MQLHLIRHLWGMRQSWEAAFPLIQSQGYSGVETGVPEPARRALFQELRQASSLCYIAQIYTNGGSVKEHLESFHRTLDAAQTVAPMLVNCHAGSDSFDERDAATFFETALRMCEDVQTPVAFETHRSRILYNPWITHRLIARFPAMNLCADYSHWVCVCERLLDDADHVFRACAERALHIHARVGYEQGPQVPDPRAPEWKAHVAKHESWWRMIWEAQLKRGTAITTLAPEFGPPNYLQTQPYSGVPLADLEEICLWQAQRQRDNFDSFMAAHDR